MRGMMTSSLSPVCGREEESTLHAFLRCPHARDIWQAMAEVWDPPDIDIIQPSGMGWLMQLLHVSSVNQ
jgi:hypothetical protein